MLEKQAKYAFIAIGSNLGNKKLNIEKAKFKLQEKLIKIIKSSSDYETLSWPNPNKPKFINVVIKIKTFFSPIELLNICNKVEIELGRKRFKKNEPRTCDIDIIDYNQKNLIYKNFDLNLPHPEISKRNFVLLPLYEISKSWKHPKTRANIGKIISSLNIEDLKIYLPQTAMFDGASF